MSDHLSDCQDSRCDGCRELPMPESVSGVDAILDGLRERYGGWTAKRDERLIPLADAEAAVHAAADARTQEIVEWLHSDEATRLLLTQSFPRLTDGLHACAAEVARRFPNGGTDA